MIAEDGPRPKLRDRSGSGTSVAFADLYEAEYDRMVRLAYLLTGRVAVAEEMVQDSFVQLHQRWDGVRHPAAYLRTSVVNACRRHHRRSSRERDHFPELVTESVSAETPELLDVLGGLPYRQRVAIVLRFYEDRSEQDIAEVLECRPATVRSLVRRGLATLRRVLTP